MIKTDGKKKEKKTQHNTCRNMFGIKKGNVGKNYIVSSFVLHCCSASVIFNLYTDKRPKKKYIST